MDDVEVFPFPADAAKQWTAREVVEVLNRLEFVEWDRMVAAPIGDAAGGLHRLLVVYGWIVRPDEHWDFVVVSFASWDDKVGYTTSSARWTETINRLLGHGPPHNECVRVVDVLGMAVNRLVEF